MILAEIKKSKHVRNKDDKREVTDHKNSADHSKKRNKNEDQKERNERTTQATHTTNSQTIKILKLLFTKIQIVFKQKIIEQQALSYFFFIQIL